MRDVIIAGGGPVGLWLGRELRLRGVDVLVLEEREERSPHSKALTIHPRTLEVFAMRGVVDDLLADGARIPGGHFAALEQRLDFGVLDTDYPFTLALPQARTEELLEGFAVAAGVELRRRHRVTDVRQDDDGVSVRVQTPTGDAEMRARYLVGCDGAGSAVRRTAGFAFPGADATTVGYLGDVVLDDPPTGPYAVHSPAGLLMIVGLPGGVSRIVGIDPELQDLKAREPSFDELRAAVIRTAGTDFGMRDPSWLSYFRDASRQVDTYRRNRVVVAGDAAHIHFPTGGVGMNVGIQDAMNLGWKLAAVVDGRAMEDLLDTYHRERHRVGADLLEFSRAQTALMTAFSPAGQALRSLMSGLIGSQPGLARELAERVTALDVAYPAGDGAHPLAGRRAPNVSAAGRDLYDALRGGEAVVLNDIDAGGRSDWQDVRTVVVRPDGYIAWASDEAVEGADVEWLWMNRRLWMNRAG